MRASSLTALWGRNPLRLLAGDTLVLGLLLGGVALSFSGAMVPRGRATAVEVRVQGRRELRLSPSEEGIREVAGSTGPTRIEFRGGRARILSSSCPLKLCQRAGWIGSAGEMLACVPNEVVVRFTGKPDSRVDAVSR